MDNVGPGGGVDRGGRPLPLGWTVVASRRRPAATSLIEQTVTEIFSALESRVTLVTLGTDDDMEKFERSWQPPV
jgi:hypothetical protein